MNIKISKKNAVTLVEEDGTGRFFSRASYLSSHDYMAMFTAAGTDSLLLRRP